MGKRPVRFIESSRGTRTAGGGAWSRVAGVVDLSRRRTFLLMTAVVAAVVGVLLAVTRMVAAGPAPATLPLRVVFTSPRGAMTDRVPSDAVVATFDRPMAPLREVPLEETAGPLRVTTASGEILSGRWRWLGTRTLAFQPSALPMATACTATIPAGTRSLDGAELEADHAWTFETPRPSLVAWSPPGGLKWVSSTTRFFLRFDQDVEPEKARPFLRMVGRASTPTGGADHVPALTVRQLSETDSTSELEGETAEGGRFYASSDQRWAVRRALVVESAEPLHAATSYTLTVAAGLPPARGDLGLSQDRTITISTPGPLTLLGIDDASKHDADASIDFKFSNPVHLADLARHLVVTPSVEIPKVENEGKPTDTPSLDLPLVPSRHYEIRLRPGFKDAFGNLLTGRATATLDTAAYPSAIVMPLYEGDPNGTGFRTVLESYLPADFPLITVNVPQLQVRMARIPRESVIPTLLRYTGKSWTPPAAGTRTVTVRSTAGVNRWRTAPLPLGDSLRPGRTGHVALRLDAGGKVDGNNTNHRYRHAWVQVTGLGITGKFSAGNTLVWVTRLRDARPVAGAAVEIRSRDNKVVWKGRTGADGVAEAPGWLALGLHTARKVPLPHFVLATLGDDLAVLGSEWGAGTSRHDLGVEQTDTVSDTPWFAIFTERGIYRPGDEVHVKGIGRVRRGTRWEIPAQKEVKLDIMAPRGEKMRTVKVALSPAGSFDLDVKLEADTAPGLYRVVPQPCDQDYWEDANGLFRVEAYRPVQFEVKVAPQKDRLVANDALAARITGRFLFGAPMRNESVEWHAMARGTRFAPLGRDGWQFGRDPWMDTGESDERGDEELASGKGTLDSEGSYQVATRAMPRVADSPALVTLEGRVTSAVRDSVSGRARITVHPADFYVGVRMSSTFLDEKKPVKASVLAVNLDNEAVAARKVSLEWVRRDWHSVRRASGGAGGSRWITEPVDQVVSQTEVTTSVQATDTEFVPVSPGFYVLRASAKDDHGKTALTTCGFYVSGSGGAGWQRFDDDRLELVADRTAYTPGDTARLLVKSPFAECSALVTVEREQVLERQVVTLKGSAPTVSIPIRPDHSPNVYVSVVLLRGRLGTTRHNRAGEDLARPTFRMGLLNLPVSTKGRALKVSLASSKATLEPGQVVSVDLQVLDAQGQPRKAEVTFAAVDQGVLDLIGYRMPDPGEIFFAQRPLSVGTCSLLHRVLGRRQYGEKGRTGGGGGRDMLAMADGGLREDFRATAAWRPTVQTDAQGHAHVTFKVPDNLTTWRLMAVAHTPDSCFGAGESEVRVRKTLSLLPSVPRFCTTGDSGSAGVLVHNGTTTPQEAVIRMAITGAKLEGEDRKSVQLEGGQSREVRFAFAAETPGSAQVSFEGRMGDFSDALRLSFPVQAPTTQEATAIFDSTRQAVRIPVEAPADAVPGTTRLELSMASSILGDLKPSLDYLRAYPYECLEQKLSRVMPYLLAPDLVASLGGAPGGKPWRTQVEAVLKGARSNQGEGGGFSLWVAGKSSPYVSAYTMEALHLARQRGFRVRQEMVTAGLEYLHEVVTRKGDAQGAGSEEELHNARALALYSLAVWGKPDPAALSLLYAQRAKMPVSAQATLLRALAATARASSSAKPPPARPSATKPGQARAPRPPAGALFTAERAEMTRLLLDRLRVSPTTASFASEASAWRFAYDSPVRTSALALEALMDSGSDFPQAPLVVRWLLQGRKSGCWRTTQENVAVFSALTRYFEKHEKTVPAMVATLTVDGKPLARESFQGHTPRVWEHTLPLAQAGATVPVEIVPEGQGLLYYGLRLRYAPKGVTPPREEGLTVLKTMEPFEGTSGPAASPQASGQATFDAGSLVKVTLSVLCSQPRRFVVVDDPVGGGLEIVQTSFATESQRLAQALETSRGAGDSPEFDHLEILDDRVRVYADALAPGLHRFTYLVRAMHPGTWVMPATRAEEMYAPEVFGSTSPRKIGVK